MGIEIAKMHLADVIHGDLTTSNMMLRQHTRLSNSGDNGDAKLTYSDLVLLVMKTLDHNANLFERHLC